MQKTVLTLVTLMLAILLLAGCAKKPESPALPEITAAPTQAQRQSQLRPRSLFTAFQEPYRPFHPLHSL